MTKRERVRNAKFRAAYYWRLTDGEYRAMVRYINGPGTCGLWDRLDGRVQAAVKSYEKLLRGAEEEG